MLSRFRSQLRLLTLSAVAVAAFAIPASAHAAVPECDSTSNFPIEGVDTYFYYDEITLTQAKADSEDASVTVTCSGDTAAPTLTIIPAQTEGAGTATVSAPVPGVNSNTWTITWNPDSAE
ncbi:MAG: hypothetical protein JWM90_144, partial [Thermoleophilia bacterium]|nr:hypothetical protein [Thermoleophilia bacterium]